MKYSTLIIAVGALLLASGVLALHGCGGGTGEGVAVKPPTPKTQVLMLRTKLVMSDADLAKMPADFIEKSAIGGWHRVSGGFEKTGPGPDIKITDGKTTVTTDAQGRFSLPSAPKTLSVIADEKKNLAVPVVNVATAKIAASPSLKTAFADKTWLLDVPSDSDAPMACCKEKKEMCANPKEAVSGIRASGEPMEGRCLDYNGWWSDGGNYGKTDWRAYRNFVMSDCDRAFFNGCWRDHYSGGCWAVHGSGGCSRVIGHSSDYHKHNFPR